MIVLLTLLYLTGAFATDYIWWHRFPIYTCNSQRQVVGWNAPTETYDVYVSNGLYSQMETIACCLVFWWFIVAVSIGSRSVCYIFDCILYLPSILNGNPTFQLTRALIQRDKEIRELHARIPR